MTAFRADPEATSETEFGNLDANLRFLEQTGQLVPGRRVLDIGAGRGSMVRWLQSKQLVVAGLELNPELIDAARVTHGALPMVRATGTSLPFAAGSFDLVVSFDVFEHIADSDAHLREVTRVLRPGGSYLLQTPNKWTNTIFETIRWRSFTRWRADHCALHSHRELVRRFARHGFSTEFADVPVVTPFFREKVRRHLGWPGVWMVALAKPDRWPRTLKTNFYVRAVRS
jgi:2-polyprenyl-3-methyl-5-hydroxy-6-metoxy-1,4-benzoquinol methylase